MGIVQTRVLAYPNPSLGRVTGRGLGVGKALAPKARVDLGYRDFVVRRGKG